MEEEHAAAIIARELGIPAIVGCNTATKFILNNSKVTVSCGEGNEGRFTKESLITRLKRLSLAYAYKIKKNDECW